MLLLKDYLEKFKKITLPDKVVREKVSEVLERKLGVEVLKKDISLQGGVVFIKASGNIKAKIFLQKSFLLKELKISLGDKSPKDIR